MHLLQLDNQHQWSVCRDGIDSVPATFVVAETAMHHCAQVLAAGQTVVAEAAVCHCAPVAADHGVIVQMCSWPINTDGAYVESDSQPHNNMALWLLKL